jgi:hypothetical protein
VHAESSPVHKEALVHFIAGALVGVLMWWPDGRMRLPVDEVNAWFRSLALPALRLLRAVRVQRFGRVRRVDGMGVST